MSRCAGCDHEHGLLEGWCAECIANGTRDRARLGRGTLGEELSMALAESARGNMAHSWHPAKLPLDDEQALPLIGHVYEDARGRWLKVDALNIGSSDGREVIGLIETLSPRDPTPMTNETRVLGTEAYAVAFSTTVAIWAAIWRDKCPAPDPRTMKVGG